MARDIRARSFDEPEVDLVDLAIREGETVLDLGANYGLYSYHLSRAVGRAGRVVAFEPVPFTVSTLRVVCRLLRMRNVEVIPKGCSDRNATVSFRVPVQDSGASMAGLAYVAGRNDDRDGSEIQVRWSATREVTAEVVALDDYLPDLPDLPFIKCDIEGGEVFAFRGARTMIERHRPTVLCEINPWYLEGFGVTVGELTDLFFELGYSLYTYVEGTPRHLREVSVADVVEGNYVFVHPRRSERLAPVLAVGAQAGRSPLQEG